MKLNNKGLTLVELIISIVLITVVMFFMYRLLSDVNSQKNDTTYAQKNQINRSEIIKLVEGEFLTKKITKIDDNSSTDKLLITFNFEEGEKSTIEAGQKNNKYYFKYTKSDGKVRTWDIEDATLNLALKAEYNNALGPILFRIEVYTQNNFNTKCPACTGSECNLQCRNNVVDDLIFSYISESNITGLKKCLGKNC